jgi:anti-anti-sigma factor
MRVSGELDLSTVPAFESEIQRLISVELKSVVLDLADLEFIDSVGLHALVRVARANGDRLRMIAPGGHVDEILRVSGIRGFLPLISWPA